MEVNVTKTFKDLSVSKARYVLLRGSTRSGKTVSIIQYLLSLMINNNNLKIIVGVQTIEQAKDSLIYDLDEWLLRLNLINDFHIKKSPHQYKHKYSKSLLTIKPCDDARKWHGAEADIFWFNEATHINYEVFFQATLRLPDRKDFLNRIILDYNPTNPYSWVRELESEEKYGGLDVFISTYLDNQFLGEAQIKNIEELKDKNYNKWLVYGKGEYGEVSGAIYKNYEIVDVIPDNIEEIYFGMDFGYANDPTAIIKVYKDGEDLYLEEILYEKGKQNPFLIDLFKKLEIKNPIIADTNEPKTIDELYANGINIQPATKGKDSIINGIDILLRYNLKIKKSSKNLITEIINYTWTKNKIGEGFINTPIGGWDHLLDALRYVALIYFNEKKKRRFKIKKIKR